MLWFLTGLTCAVLLLGVFKLRNKYLVPFCPKLKLVGREVPRIKPIKLVESAVCALVALVAGPFSIIGLIVYVLYTTYELILAVFYWLQLNKPELFTREL